MQLADACKFAIILFLGYMIVFGLWRMFPIRYEHFSELTLRDIASRDLSIVGIYDDKFVVSVYKLLENIYQKLYVYAGMSFHKTLELLCDKASEFTYDPDGKFTVAVNDVCYDLEKRWDEHKKTNSENEPFNVDIEEWELPEPPTSLMCNDHIDIHALYALYYEVLARSG